eukprot:TRINITY_DN26936_c0_g1_i1.p1 TRINITY_DN26936_c0_g1~~TRINITY_DN26936_c0_g1_i1.p1  ORF type:complete len:371 (+),score=70.03 TRINITY_DN26936_c0_g1_i1:111-1223(+)
MATVDAGFVEVALPDSSVVSRTRLRGVSVGGLRGGSRRLAGLPASSIGVSADAPVANSAGDIKEASVQPWEIRVVQRLDVLDDPTNVDADSGVKVWEGGVDLAGHILEVEDVPVGAVALELGAGHGLPGIVLAARRGAARVDFHDLSIDVLRGVTATNVAANCQLLIETTSAATAVAPKVAAVRFLVGDWVQFRAAAQAAGLVYDVILAAEAIYRADAYADIADILQLCLAPKGIAWFAGKRFYFGCGGGTASFCKFLRERGFQVDVDVVVEDGRSNLREILRVTRGSQTSALPLGEHVSGDVDVDGRSERSSDCRGDESRGVVGAVASIAVADSGACASAKVCDVDESKDEAASNVVSPEAKRRRQDTL